MMAIKNGGNSRPKKQTARTTRNKNDATAKKRAQKTGEQTKDDGANPRDIRLEIVSLFVLAFALVLFLSLITYSGGVADGQSGNWIGKAGNRVATFALQGFGYSAYLVTFAIAAIGVVLGMRRAVSIKIKETSGFLMGALSCSILFELLIASEDMLYEPGGLVGRFARDGLNPLIGEVGLGISAGLLLIVAVVMATNQPPLQAAAQIARGLWIGLKTAGKGLWWSLKKAGALVAVMWRRSLDALSAWRTARAERQAEREAELERIALREQQARDEAEADEPEAIEDDEPYAGPIIAGLESDDDAEKAAPLEADEAVTGKRSLLDRGETELVIERRRWVEAQAADDADGGDELQIDDEYEANDEATRDTVAPRHVQTEGDTDEDEFDDGAPPEIVDRRPKRATEAEIANIVITVEEEKAAEPYELPSVNLLDYRADSVGDIDRDQLYSNARLLEQTLLDYKIEGRVKEIHPGPVITMYEFAPARGTKLSKIANLEDDLAMALAALKVRIVAPIPGKSVVGIEVPSANRETVYMKEIIGHRAFSESKGKLTIALGKDIFGYPVVANLQKMPHLLIAGATGAGKSVGVNVMILSILFRCTPEDVRFILIDPKRLEFNFYEGIPHLLLPVVTDPKQAALALGWVVHEMDTRYQMLSEWGVKNIDSYNKLVKTLHEASERRGGDFQKVAEEFAMAEGGDAEMLAKKLKKSPMPTRMPFIIVVIDELADLMMVAGKDVELSIARLAQLARASGIHLIVATQRPSTDVLTGLIKNNFPARLSFRVAQKVDSRVILDMNGAEALLGRGDMLYIPSGGETRRVHGAYVSEKETRRVVSFTKKQRKATYQNDILEKIEQQAEEEKAESDEYDSEYDKAVAIVCDSGKASISMLQRKLRIGYNRAARIVEKMEDEGIVGPSDGVKGRPVYGHRIPK